MQRYKIILEYDGTGTVGWQVQDNGVSIQGLVQDAIFKFCGEVVEVSGCGRTDAGVHAFAMPAHFDIDRETDANTVMRAVNFYLKNSPVVIIACEHVRDDFHARFDCLGRSYRYVILNRAAAPIIDKNRVWFVPKKLDIEQMRNAAVKLIGTHDWTSFRAAECQSASPVKTLDEITITDADDLIIIDVAAKSFLHHMVRNIVGTLVEIGSGKPHDIDKIFATKSRSAAGATAPACGLYFASAKY